MAKKTTITLQDGTVVDCGLKEHNDMIQALKNKNPKQVAISCAKLLLSSDALMRDLTQKLNCHRGEVKRLPHGSERTWDGDFRKEVNNEI